MCTVRIYAPSSLYVGEPIKVDQINKVSQWPHFLPTLGSRDLNVIIKHRERSERLCAHRVQLLNSDPFLRRNPFTRLQISSSEHISEAKGR